MTNKSRKSNHPFIAHMISSQVLDNQMVSGLAVQPSSVVPSPVYKLRNICRVVQLHIDWLSINRLAAKTPTTFGVCCSKWLERECVPETPNLHTSRLWSVWSSRDALTSAGVYA
jgi:hypothetical protein